MSTPKIGGRQEMQEADETRRWPFLEAFAWTVYLSGVVGWLGWVFGAPRCRLRDDAGRGGVPVLGSNRSDHAGGRGFDVVGAMFLRGQ